MTPKMKKMVDGAALHLGPMHRHHTHPPAPFNPLADPKAEERYSAVSASMNADNFYATHTRAECKAEWARRYAELEKS